MEYNLRFEYKDQTVDISLIGDHGRLADVADIISSLRWELFKLLPEVAPDDSGVATFSMGNNEEGFKPISQFPVNPDSYNARYLTLVQLRQPPIFGLLCEHLAGLVWLDAKKELPSRLAFHLALRNALAMLRTS